MSNLISLRRSLDWHHAFPTVGLNIVFVVKLSVIWQPSSRLANFRLFTNGAHSNIWQPLL